MFQPNMFKSHQHFLDQKLKKKCSLRHSQHQIDEMEAFFKNCTHPDEKERIQLGRMLGLEPLQIKFWFQNRRTQMKAKEERSKNSQLRDENANLEAENMQLKKALNNSICSNCSGPAVIGEMCFDEQHLLIENVRLKEELDRISELAAKYVGSASNFTSQSGNGGLDGEKYGYSEADLIRLISIPGEADKPLIIELAVAGMDELIRLAHTGEPMWIPNGDSIFSPILNEDEYVKTFPRGIGPTPLNFRTEASKESAIVNMDSLKLVGMFMDVNQWSNIFAGMVSRAKVVDVFSTGVGGSYNEALQLMIAEFQLPSPSVPTRDVYFVRYCKQLALGIWAVVDVSVDDLLSNSMPSRCRRRPSGCVIHELSNGYSKVTWIEHVEVDDRVANNIYGSLVSSGLAFGAKRWVATLDRQCKRLASVMSINISVGYDCEVKKIMLKLAERMVKSFCYDVSASTAHFWTALPGSGSDTDMVMTRKSVNDPGKPPGVVLIAATSLWLPVPPKHILDFLRDENSRTEMDIMSNWGPVQKVVHMVNGRDPDNCVSLMRVNSNMLVLQESCTDSSGSYVIYAPVDIGAMKLVLNGGDPESVLLLPSGFAIFPDGNNSNGGGSISEMNNTSGGSLLTFASQIIEDSSAPTGMLNGHIKWTVERIRNALACGNA